METCNGRALDAALGYAALGYRVFPCGPGGKKPITAHGFHDATTGQREVEVWWSECPRANLAIPTAGLVVIDIDGADNPWPGNAERVGDLARAPMSLTPHGGRHYIFRQPAGRDWRNTEGKIAPHVDTRANGGYIVVPPSLVDERPYRWSESTPLPPMSELPEPPGWLVELLDGLSGSGKQPRDPSNAHRTPAGSPIPEGQRNATLASLGGTMRRSGTGREEILAALERINIDRCQPPLDADEVAQIATSISRYEPDQGAVRRMTRGDTECSSKPDGNRIDGNETEGKGNSPKGGQGQPLAQKLIPIVLEGGIELFHDQRGEPFAAVPLDRGRRIMSLGAKSFTRWLSRMCWNELGCSLGSEGGTSVRNTLAGFAVYDGPQYPLHVRCAAHEGAIWIDLDGIQAVSVRPGRWEIVGEPPILFRPSGHQRPLPEPARGGDPDLLLPFINLKDPADQALLLCYLVAGLVPDIPIAALIVHGVQGAAKTTLLKLIKSLLDPSAVSVRGAIRKPDEFSLAAFQNRVLFFDNLSHMPDWLSDALCRAVTGEGWSKRALFTDEDSTVLEYRGLVGFSGINLVADRADLLDRSIVLELAALAPKERREERELWREFELARPQILGGLLDALARAMQVEPGIRLRSQPRMADFARWGTAAAVGLRRNPRTFTDAYLRNVGRQNEAAVGASPVAQAVLVLMDRHPSWSGSPAELLDRLEEIAGPTGIDTRSKCWPKSASWLSRRLKEVQTNLLALGVQVRVEAGRTAGSREITVTAMTAVTARDGNAVIRDPLHQRELCGHDSNDSISTSFEDWEEG